MRRAQSVVAAAAGVVALAGVWMFDGIRSLSVLVLLLAGVLWVKLDRIRRDPSKVVLDRSDGQRAALLLERIANADDGPHGQELLDVAALLRHGDTGAPGSPYSTVQRRQDGHPW